MHFLEFETWKLKDGVNVAEYDQMLKDWFQFLHDHKEELFQEWISAKYFKETDIEGVVTGRYIMLFEYESLEGHHTYKKRRNYQGPYEPYKLVDPYYHYFNHEETTCSFWQPIEPENWVDVERKR